MEPRLIAVTGLSKGTTFALTKDEVSLGRDQTNTIHFNEPSVSRKHCLIKRESVSAINDERNFQFTLVDLESYNGTFVNGVPVREQKLAHGDQIALGDVTMLFLLKAGEAGTAPLELTEDNLITRSTVRLRREDALYLQPETLVAELSQSDRVGRDLSTLLSISNSIGAIRSRAELQTYLLAAIRGVIPSERQAIIFADRDFENFESICGWTKFTGPDDSIKPSRNITRQVLRERVALLSNDLIDSSPNVAGASLVEANICSVLCVPLMVFEKPLGVIYLDTSDESLRFDENHLQLLTGIAGIAAVAFENSRHVESLEDENQRLQQEIKIEHKLVGESQPLRNVLQFIAKVAPADSTVLIRGESGTGKELAARAIHLNSGRANKPFVAINCATLTETLIETELFGHEKGAFTGAIALKRGKLEIADGGTIFLDELAELTPLIQAKLLRVLQEREFERLGGMRPIKVDVRIITATNQNLEEAIKEKRFREDLYYRLNVVSVVMPALKDRREDIPLLANYFVSIFSKKCKRRVRGISQEARALLQAYDWPGNVRELENAIERAVVLGNDELITPDDLPERLLEVHDGVASSADFYQAVTNAKKQLILNAITQAAGNYTQAARSLGIHPNNLHRLIRTLNLKSEIKTP
jgi:transcriptional regulator with GAF, ATPase, and Fis domain